ncbi:probable G-protein coupled receptor Mth-like 1 isoform X1 [Macrosteles quadrilineatus]|uniref:probable G-protein coupled receptor Mth-like 1 isoform X1 n=1 Tax=Macrosteles quadrilineatus TaxID=74068 RepID=UPI0023E1AAAD|nr:probable G-protein coupled receptor Mth-like 1 isoform X1 [Macrosteles quadrilineatus]
MLFIFLLFTNSLASEVPWLPKCCPSGMQMAGDGKSCVEDAGVNLHYNVTNSILPDTLTVVINDMNVSYLLEHRSKFNCVRQEVFVIKDDLEVRGEEVVVTDDHGDPWVLARGEMCVDSLHLPGLVPERLYVALLCPDCKRFQCVHKCCPESKDLQVSDDGGMVDCVPSDTSWTDDVLRRDNRRPFLIHGFPECSNQLYLEYTSSWNVQDDHLLLGEARVPRAHYCVDRTSRGSALLACRLPPTLKPAVYGGLFVLGAVFLGITLVLHLWLPELRKSLHSRVLVAHVACLLAGYVGLAVVNLAPLPAPSCACSVTAFTIQFAILAAMFWLNVMCVDIAWTFSGLRAPKGSQSLDSDGHKFIYYSLFAWGGSAAFSGITAFLEFSPAVPSMSKFKPSFGTTRCWFEHWESVLLLVYGPMGLLLMANLALFIYTAGKIRQTHRDTANIVQHAGSKLRQDTNRLLDVESIYNGTTANKTIRFSLYLKLFGLMGVTWVFELISWVAGGSESYWYVTDAINALRGVFIFILFCCKEKVLGLVKAKLHIGKTPKFPKHPRKSQASSKMTSSITSQRTNSIQLSQVS